ncbi:hypothetical protein CJF31_00002664 [Rutstroemia sp. NJR-2017a BVV2]|nr:hypothetical protein CJF31_00002664 [Rutstroemia sp. NJR-2017a BVV2]
MENSGGGDSSLVSHPGVPARAKAKRDAEWKSIRSFVHDIYVKDKKTLKETKDAVWRKYSFQSGTRKWKEKLKEWKFEKHISMGDMNIIVAKQQQRHKEGKDTVFTHCSNEVSAERIETFKRRKVANESLPISPSAELTSFEKATPENITYHTPNSHPVELGAAIVQELSEDTSERPDGLFSPVHLFPESRCIDISVQPAASSWIGTEVFPEIKIYGAWCQDDTSSLDSKTIEESTSIGDILPHVNILPHKGDTSGDINDIGSSMNSQENCVPTLDLHSAGDELQRLEDYRMRCCANGIRSPSAKSIFDSYTVSEKDLFSHFLRILSGSASDEAFSSARDAHAQFQCVAFLIDHKESFVRKDEYELIIEEAKNVFRKGIGYFDSDPELQLRYSYYLGRLLRAHGCRQSGEICRLLCSVISMNVRFPTAFTQKCKCILSGAIKEFSEFYRQIDEEFWRNITETLDELSEMVNKKDEKSFFFGGHVLSFEIRCSVIALAGQLSEHLEFAVTKMLLFVPDKYDPLSAYVYLQRCLNYQRQDKLQKSFRELQNASRALFTNLPTLLNFERTELEICNYLGLVLASLHKVNNDELRLTIKMDMKRGIDEWLRRNVSRNGSAKFPDKKSILDSLMSKSKRIGSSDNSSARYGVTYSVSTVTGVSDSVFMVP